MVNGYLRNKILKEVSILKIFSILIIVILCNIICMNLWLIDINKEYYLLKGISIIIIVICMFYNTIKIIRFYKSKEFEFLQSLRISKKQLIIVFFEKTIISDIIMIIHIVSVLLNYEKISIPNIFTCIVLSFIILLLTKITQGLLAHIIRKTLIKNILTVSIIFIIVNLGKAFREYTLKLNIFEHNFKVILREFVTYIGKLYYQINSDAIIFIQLVILLLSLLFIFSYFKIDFRNKIEDKDKIGRGISRKQVLKKRNKFIATFIKDIKLNLPLIFIYQTIFCLVGFINLFYIDTQETTIIVILIQVYMISLICYDLFKSDEEQIELLNILKITRKDAFLYKIFNTVCISSINPILILLLKTITGKIKLEFLIIGILIVLLTSTLLAFVFSSLANIFYKTISKYTIVLLLITISMTIIPIIAIIVVIKNLKFIRKVTR